MKEVTLIGRYRVYRHRGRWIVTALHAHGDACISSHGSHATAVGAANRYDDTDRRRAQCYNELVKRFV